MPNSRSDPMQILLVEDSEADEVLFREAVRAAQVVSEIAVARSLSEARECLEERVPDLAVLDLNLADSAGFETFERLREAAPELAVVVLSGEEDRELQGRAIRAGAYDFLSKGELTSSTLLRVLLHARERAHYHRDLQLAHRRLEAKEKLEAVGQLAGGIAHDFNNMLSVIRCSVDLVRHDALDVDSGLDDIEQAAARAQDLTQRLLAFARHQVPEVQATSLKEALERVLRSLPRALGSTIRIERRWDRDALHVPADEGQIEQVLLNLCLNARDAMQGEGTIVVEAARVTITGGEDEVDLIPGDYACLSVVDHGHGIQKADLRSVFDPFFTTKEPGAGTGLGLSSVYGIAQQLGGSVAIRSEVGLGTSVAVYFPLIDQLETRKSAEERTPTSEISCRRILLVDDDRPLQRLMQRILEEGGHDVLAVEDPEEALRALDTTPFDIVVSDVVMPRIDGRTIMKEVGRRQPEAKRLLISGFIPEDGIGVGDCEYLSKPITRDRLLEKIAEIVRV